MPPIGDFVKGYEASAWVGVGAPKGTPPEIVAVLNKQINAALGDATIQKRLTDIGAIPLPPIVAGRVRQDSSPTTWRNGPR